VQFTADCLGPDNPSHSEAMNNPIQQEQFTESIDLGHLVGPFPIAIEQHPIPERDEDAWEKATGTRVLGICSQKRPGCFYLNPSFTVHAPHFDSNFIKAVRACQASWCRYTAKLLRPCHLRRLMKDAPFMKRQLAYTGILIVEGVHIAPQDWTHERIAAVLSTALSRSEKREKRMHR
jgi:hypothetical protein